MLEGARFKCKITHVIAGQGDTRVLDVPVH